MTIEPEFPISKEIQVYLNFIRRLCPAITDEELAWHSRRTSVVQLKKKDIFIKAGEQQKNVGFVYKGLLRSYYTNAEKDEITQQFVPEGMFAAYYPALLDNRSCPFSYQCLEDTILVIIPYNAILEAYDYSHSFERFGRLIAEKICEQHHLRVESFLFNSAGQRYMDFMRDYPNLLNRISVTHLCSYLGVERQTLTRIRRKLAKPK